MPPSRGALQDLLRSDPASAQTLGETGRRAGNSPRRAVLEHDWFSDIQSPPCAVARVDEAAYLRAIRRPPGGPRSRLGLAATGDGRGLCAGRR
mmetsp:Transcript_23910/g.69176  ORF Transcript_23910/g.69176 Transcript_23910/m.69176 type:complete len:93 (-) Transcript_23910:70-348(-)